MNNEKIKKSLKEQKRLSGCSGLFCPNIYLYGHSTVKEKDKSFDNDRGPFALGKIVQVPNYRKMIEICILEYDDAHKELDCWMLELPKNDFVVQFLKQGIGRADKANWRLIKKKRNCNKEN